MEKYDLEFLSKEFGDHMGGKSHPDFDLPKALKTIVDELIALKKHVIRTEDSLVRDVIHFNRYLHGVKDEPIRSGNTRDDQEKT